MRIETSKPGSGEGGVGLTFERVTKRYGDVTAVSGIDIEVLPGEFLTLLGPSGSGKSTLLMMIAGFQDVTEGDIRVNGRSVVDVPPEKRNFGMVFQGYALFPHMTVRDNIAYPLSVRGRPRDEIARRVGEMLDLVQLQAFGDRMPRQLSGGQQQRVALARALCFAPELLLLDEPLGALDKKLRVEVQEQLKDIHRRVGTTFVYVTHDQEEALSMSDRIVIMNHGRVVQIGTPVDLYERPRSKFVASFLGKSNFIRRDGVLHSLRPEKIDIASAGLGAAGSIRATVRTLVYFGSALKFVVATEAHGDLEIMTDAWRNPHHFAEGQTVDIGWADAAAVAISDGEGP